MSGVRVESNSIVLQTDRQTDRQTEPLLEVLSDLKNLLDIFLFSKYSLFKMTY